MKKKTKWRSWRKASLKYVPLRHFKPFQELANSYTSKHY